MDCVTTREAAAILEASPAEARKLLKAAGVPYRTIGSRRICGYLWDTKAVTELRDVLAKRVGKGEQNVD